MRCSSAPSAPGATAPLPPWTSSDGICLIGHYWGRNCQGRAERALATATLAAPAPRAQPVNLTPLATSAMLSAQASSFLASPAVCSIDPGVRTFATVLDVNREQLLEVGANDQAQLFQLLLHIEQLNKRAKEGNARLR
ncbi:uncharacterized protein PSFLO_02063 [Pseudozyma flocculosa]|uniref:Uncharacterized protein n=1 Tax=Pseudozyma flocculosa TaxID=84751 RepID=A0A5C3EWZ8_9BASI|nr:uncharacterized protein PSFLO_02063 [Pseudozyma flocculosa]